MKNKAVDTISHGYKRFIGETDDELIYRITGEKDKIGTWEDVAVILNELLGVKHSESFYRRGRKSFDSMIGAYQKKTATNDAQIVELDKKIQELRKERIKLQTANVERNRIDRSEARQEMYYEFVGNMVNTLPVPEFTPLFDGGYKHKIEYLCCISDIHYGATFLSVNNEYSPEICKSRFEELADSLYEFIIAKKLSRISIASLGDTIQGCLRISDLKINDSSVVKSVVEVSRLIALFLTSLSKYVEIDYYHVPTANHTQIRPIGSKASELADEDLEYVIGHYIQDLCRDNKNIKVHLVEDKQHINLNINGFDISILHGHQIKNVESSIKDMSTLNGGYSYDYLIMGHYHGSKEITAMEKSTNDAEVLVCPSFVGSDPYSDSIMRGSKAAVKIFGFDEIYGYTDMHKIILN